MTIFRVARESDIESIALITSKAGVGLSTVPKGRAAVESYVDDTAKFMSGKGGSNRVLFVSDDKGVVTGISGIIIQTDVERPFYSFEHKRVNGDQVKSRDLTKGHDVLQLSQKYNEHTELGTLFLSPDCRGGGVGRLLSMGRLAFIESHRSSFKDNLMADIRGWYDETNSSPFWLEFASRFVDASFEDANRFVEQDKDFIRNAFPHHPVYLCLLNRAAQECVGRANDNSIGALKLLQAAGFTKSNYCNILDGGPALECKVAETIVAKSANKALNIGQLSNPTPALHFSGHGYDFKAGILPADMTSLTASEDAAASFGHTNNMPVSLSLIQEMRMNNDVAKPSTVGANG